MILLANQILKLLKLRNRSPSLKKSVNNWLRIERKLPRQWVMQMNNKRRQLMTTKMRKRNSQKLQKKLIMLIPKCLKASRRKAWISTKWLKMQQRPKRSAFLKLRNLLKLANLLSHHPLNPLKLWKRKSLVQCWSVWTLAFFRTLITRRKRSSAANLTRL